MGIHGFRPVQTERILYTSIGDGSSKLSNSTDCLQVPKSWGEKALAALKQLKLFNSQLKVEHDEDSVFIPLNRKPTRVEARSLNRALASFKVSEHTFGKRVRKTYKPVDFLADQIPSDLLSDVPHGIDFIGDIAVVEIPPALERYKRIVGEAILKAYNRVETVLRKAGGVRGIYRIRDYERLAGKNKTATIHREFGCLYNVDLAKAYFSPRLSYEHSRVSSLVQEKEKVVDMFAGVGPFSILIAKKHSDVHVHAIDMNPQAFELLKKNIVLNRVADKVTPILGDAKEVVSHLAGIIDRVVMNLPGAARDFLGSACTVFKPRGGIIHYYTFMEGNDPKENARIQLSEALKDACGNRKYRLIFAKVVRATAPFAYQTVVDAEIR